MGLRTLTDSKTANRNSGLELLKILSMFLIVLSHVTQTLYAKNVHYAPDYLVDVTHSTTNVSNLILSWFSGAGQQGNLIFFICSAWFLVDSTRLNTKKITRIILDVWIINVIFLFAILLSGSYEIAIFDIIKSLFPTVFSLNWYITCYLMLYAMHLGLNKIIRSFSQVQHLSTVLVMIALYYLCNFLKDGLFFASELVMFVVVYFIVAYMKLYLTDYCSSIKKNVITLIIGAVTTPVLILITNFLGLHISVFSDKLTRWGYAFSPFLLLTAISLFNLFNLMNFKNRFINYISSLTLMIYVIHENYLFRRYIRPQIWIYIHQNIGYEYIVLIDILFALCLFVAAVAAASLYNAVLKNPVTKLNEIIHRVLTSLFSKLTNRLIKLK